MPHKLAVSHVPAILQVSDTLSPSERLDIFRSLPDQAARKLEGDIEFWYEESSKRFPHHKIILAIYDDVVNFLNFHYDFDGNFKEVIVSPTLRVPIDPPEEQISGDPLIAIFGQTT